jgi:hypothetical protein
VKPRRRTAAPVLVAAAAIALTAGGVLAPSSALAATTDTSACAVSDAQLHWGFKESFRSYISGTIANGEWSVADGAAYATPEFSWSGGSGSLSAVTFAGAVTFTGHGGILNTTIANPVVQLTSTSSAHLLLDVTGTTQQGAEVAESAVDFATLDLSSATVDTSTPGVLVYSAVPAVLTEAGSAAFGTYEAGEALDPITLSVSTSAECITAAITPPPVDFGWVPWFFAVPVLSALAALAVRRRSQRA